MSWYLWFKFHYLFYSAMLKQNKAVVLFIIPKISGVLIFLLV